MGKERTTRSSRRKTTGKYSTVKMNEGPEKPSKPSSSCVTKITDPIPKKRDRDEVKIVPPTAPPAAKAKAKAQELSSSPETAEASSIAPSKGTSTERPKSKRRRSNENNISSATESSQNPNSTGTKNRVSNTQANNSTSSNNSNSNSPKSKPTSSTTTTTSTSTTTASSSTSTTTITETKSDNPSKELPLVLMGDKGRGSYECDFCHMDISQVPRIRCAVCPDFDLCLECFSASDRFQAAAAVQEHLDADARRVFEGQIPVGHERTHGYHVADSTRYILFPSFRGVKPILAARINDGEGHSVDDAVVKNEFDSNDYDDNATNNDNRDAMDTNDGNNCTSMNIKEKQDKHEVGEQLLEKMEREVDGKNTLNHVNFTKKGESKVDIEKDDNSSTMKQLESSSSTPSSSLKESKKGIAEGNTDTIPEKTSSKKEELVHVASKTDVNNHNIDSITSSDPKHAPVHHTGKQTDISKESQKETNTSDMDEKGKCDQGTCPETASTTGPLGNIEKSNKDDNGGNLPTLMEQDSAMKIGDNYMILSKNDKDCLKNNTTHPLNSDKAETKGSSQYKSDNNSNTVEMSSKNNICQNIDKDSILCTNLDSLESIETSQEQNQKNTNKVENTSYIHLCAGKKEDIACTTDVSNQKEKLSNINQDYLNVSRDIPMGENKTNNTTPQKESDMSFNASEVEAGKISQTKPSASKGLDKENANVDTNDVNTNITVTSSSNSTKDNPEKCRQDESQVNQSTNSRQSDEVCNENFIKSNLGAQVDGSQLDKVENTDGIFSQKEKICNQQFSNIIVQDNKLERGNQNSEESIHLVEENIIEPTTTSFENSKGRHDKLAPESDSTQKKQLEENILSSADVSKDESDNLTNNLGGKVGQDGFESNSTTTEGVIAKLDVERTDVEGSKHTRNHSATSHHETHKEDNLCKKKDKEYAVEDKKEKLIITDDLVSMWTIEEDLRLLEAISTLGLGNWPDISEAVCGGMTSSMSASNKNAERCMERYIDDYLGRYGHIVPPYTIVWDDDEHHHQIKGERKICSQTDEINVSMSQTGKKRKRIDRKSHGNKGKKKISQNYCVVPTASLPEYDNIWPEPFLPIIPGKEIKFGDDVGRDLALKAEHYYVKTISNINSKKELEELRNKWISNYLLKPEGPTALPPRLDNICKLPGAEMAGYMPRRGDFDVEWDNDAEKILADMEFSPSDQSQERELKIKVIEIYNRRLAERDKRKKFLIERNLVDYRKNQIKDQKLSSDERELINRMRLFARFHSAAEHENFIQGLLKAKQLRKKLAELQSYKNMGIESMLEVERFELDKDRRESHRIAVMQRELEEEQKLSNNNDKSGNLNNDLPEKVSTSEHNYEQNSKQHSGGSRTPGSAYGKKYKKRKAKHFSSSNYATDSKEDECMIEKTTNDNSLPKNNLSGLENNILSFGSNSSLISAQNKNSAENSSDGDKDPTHVLLSSNESKFCEKIDIPPEEYLKVKRELLKLAMQQGLCNGDLKSTLFKIDVEKRDNVVEFIMRAGWISSIP